MGHVSMNSMKRLIPGMKLQAFVGSGDPQFPFKDLLSTKLEYQDLEHYSEEVVFILSSYSL